MNSSLLQFYSSRISTFRSTHSYKIKTDRMNLNKGKNNLCAPVFKKLHMTSCSINGWRLKTSPRSLTEGEKFQKII